MGPFKRFRLKNAMLFSNLVANIIGVLVILYLVQNRGVPRPPEVVQLGKTMDRIFMPFAFMVPLILVLFYEKPIRRYIDQEARNDPTEEALKNDAHRRVLNEPFFLIALDAAVWLLASFIYPFVFWLNDAGAEDVSNAFFHSFYTGLITTTVAFFVLEFHLQRRVIPYFFPNGGLYKTPKTIRIHIRTRLVALLFACNLVPLFSILFHILTMTGPSRDPALVVQELRASFMSEVPIFILVGIWLTFLVSSNLTRPLQDIIRVLRKVRHGRFDDRVRVTSNDEIGYTGEVINEMTEGLKERDFVKETFGKYVTKEIRDQILSGGISLDGEHREVTVLFADLRNFTPLVERTPPREVVKIINRYFEEMDDAIRAHRGLVLQYIGDEIEAVFGAPIPLRDHPRMAVMAALDMRKRLKMVNGELVRQGYGPLAHGIGIHTGDVVAANIGSPDRLSYALVGDTVNLASRLQGLTKEFGTEIIISAATRARLNGDVSFAELPPTAVKGKRDPIHLYGLR
jgi:adenylate cyclase